MRGTQTFGGGYRPGDTFVNTGRLALNAVLTGGAATVYVSVPLDKPIDPSVTRVTCNKFVAGFRVPAGGYLAGQDSYDYKSNAQTITGYVTNHAYVTFAFTFSAALQNGTNNTPVGAIITAGNISISFS